MTARVVPEAFAVMALDPGGRSGVAAGVFQRMPTVQDTLRECMKCTGIATWELRGEHWQQARELADLWQEFVFHASVECATPADEIMLAFETFELRQRHADLAPVRVLASFEDRMMGVAPELYRGLCPQSPAEAKGYLTDERMKRWGLWVKGSPHKRDAVRHLALRVSKTLVERD